MDRAVVPGAPFTPDVRRNFLLGALAGILLALGLVLGDRLPRRHHQDARRHHAPPEAAVPRPGAGGEGQQSPAAVAGSAPRVRRGVPRAAHVARLQQRQRGHARHRGHERAAARGQDDDGLQHGDRAGVRRLARAAHRRRHAAPERLAHARHREHDRSLAPADRPGDGAAGDPPHATCRTCG